MEVTDSHSMFSHQYRLLPRQPRLGPGICGVILWAATWWGSQGQPETDRWGNISGITISKALSSESIELVGHCLNESFWGETIVRDGFKTQPLVEWQLRLAVPFSPGGFLLFFWTMTAAWNWKQHGHVLKSPTYLGSRSRKAFKNLRKCLRTIFWFVIYSSNEFREDIVTAICIQAREATIMEKSVDTLCLILEKKD